MMGSTATAPGPVRRFLLPGLFVAGLFAALVWRQPGCDDQARGWTFQGQTMGTTYMVKVRFVDPPSDGATVSAFITATRV
jgi:acyl dehydratase